MGTSGVLGIGSLILLAIASYEDIRFHKIPNWLTCLGVLLAIIYHILTGGLNGLMLSIQGLLIGLLLLMPFFLIGAMGAGDVKLFGAVGAILGPAKMVDVLLFTAVAGGVYASAVLLLNRHCLGPFLRRYLTMGKLLFRTGRFVYVQPSEEEKLQLCFGVAIAIGAMSFIVLERLGFSSFIWGR